MSDSIRDYLDVFGDEGQAVLAFMAANPTVRPREIAVDLMVIDLDRRYPLTFAFLRECERCR